jgi:hypothetical protein
MRRCAMKRSLLAVVFMMVVVGFGFSQGGYIGPRVSVPISWATGEDWDDLVDSYDGSDPFGEFGILLGLEYTYYFSDRFSLELAGLWGLYSWAFEGKDAAGNNVDYSGDLDFLEFPILGSYRIPLGTGALTFGGGPMVIFPTGQLVVGEPDATKSEDLLEESTDNPLVLGGTAGLGYDIPLWRGILSLDARYVRTVTKFFEEDSDHKELPADFDEFYINSVAIYLSYAFALGGN